MLIRNYMTPDPVTIQPETPVEDIARLLLAHRINGVPVVDGVWGAMEPKTNVSPTSSVQSPLPRHPTR
ncbi:TPA: CBS domain-containing protein [Pseudomonas aeruginosa]|nr:CBS domain-containing protein [Pseudomonas aeruginosa]HEK2589381.1 CBS domain-containing protein [Pseudomonas aeruginosa]HEK3694138.1 CBS domain-containing protein [Pseudomonas aeruginosa]